MYKEGKIHANYDESVVYGKPSESRNEKKNHKEGFAEEERTKNEEITNSEYSERNNTDEDEEEDEDSRRRKKKEKKKKEGKKGRKTDNKDITLETHHTEPNHISHNEKSQYNHFNYKKVNIPVSSSYQQRNYSHSPFNYTGNAYPMNTNKPPNFPYQNQNQQQYNFQGYYNNNNNLGGGQINPPPNQNFYYTHFPQGGYGNSNHGGGYNQPPLNYGGGPNSNGNFLYPLNNTSNNNNNYNTLQTPNTLSQKQGFNTNNTTQNQNLLFLMNSQNLSQGKNDGFLYPLGYEAKGEDKLGEGEGVNKKMNFAKDPYSCSYCEEYYKMALFNSVPLKLFCCTYCQNMINQKSLQYYYKKYEFEINKKIRGSIEESLNTTEKKTLSTQNGAILKKQSDSNTRNSFEGQNLSTSAMNFNREKERSVEIEEVKEEYNEESQHNANLHDNDVSREDYQVNVKNNNQIEEVYEEEQDQEQYNEEDNHYNQYTEYQPERRNSSQNDKVFEEKPKHKSKSSEKPLLKNPKEVIEIAVNEENVSGNTNLAEMFKKKKQGLIDRLEKRKVQESLKSESKEKPFMEDYDKKKKLNQLKNSSLKEESREVKESKEVKEVKEIKEVKEPNPSLIQRLSNGEKASVSLELYR